MNDTSSLFPPEVDAFAASLQIAVITTDLTGIVTFWNDEAERAFGFSAQEAVGHPIFELTVPVLLAEQAEAIMSGLIAGIPWSGHIRCRRKDGTEATFFVVDSPIRDNTGNVVAITGISHEVRENIAQRQQPSSPATRRQYTASLDPWRNQLLFDAKAISLTRAEFGIVRVLMQYSGKTASPERIAADTFDEVPVNAARLVRVHIHRIRKKFEGCGLPQDLIETVPGLGYRLSSSCAFVEGITEP